MRKTPTDDDLEFDIAYFLTGGTELQAKALDDNPNFALLTTKLLKPGKEMREVFKKTTMNGVVSAKLLREKFQGQLAQLIDSGELPNVKLREHGPAFQLDFYRGRDKFFSVDVVPHFDLGSNACYVPKLLKHGPELQYPEAWFRSYALEERKKFDGMDRDNGCRKKVLRILKVCR